MCYGDHLSDSHHINYTASFSGIITIAFSVPKFTKICAGQAQAGYVVWCGAAAPRRTTPRYFAGAAKPPPHPPLYAVYLLTTKFTKI